MGNKTGGQDLHLVLQCVNVTTCDSIHSNFFSSIFSIFHFSIIHYHFIPKQLLLGGSDVISDEGRGLNIGDLLMDTMH